MPVGRPPFMKASIFLLPLGNLLKRDFFEPFFAEEHEDSVSSDTMQPSGEGRLAAKITDSAEHGKKGLLRQILGLRWISCHAKTVSIDARKVQVVEAFESCCIAMPCPAQGFGFRQSGL